MGIIVETKNLINRITVETSLQKRVSKSLSKKKVKKKPKCWRGFDLNVKNEELKSVKVLFIYN